MSAGWSLTFLALAIFDLVLDAFLVHRLFGVAADCAAGTQSDYACQLSLAFTTMPTEALAYLLVIGVVGHFTLALGHNLATLRGQFLGSRTGVIIFSVGIMVEDLLSAWALADVFRESTYDDDLSVVNSIFTTIKFIVFLLVIVCCCSLLNGDDEDEDGEEEWFAMAAMSGGGKCCYAICFLYGAISAGIFASILIKDLGKPRAPHLRRLFFPTIAPRGSTRSPIPAAKTSIFRAIQPTRIEGFTQYSWGSVAL